MTNAPVHYSNESAPSKRNLTPGTTNKASTAALLTRGFAQLAASNLARTSRSACFAEILRCLPGTTCTVQCARILEALRRLGSISTYEAMRYLDCYCARSRVRDLRRSGENISTSMGPGETESGVVHRIGYYSLTGAAQ
jgi:hypothetical protein